MEKNGMDTKMFPGYILYALLSKLVYRHRKRPPGTLAAQKTVVGAT